MTDHRLMLPSGRGLAYAEFGAAAGMPVVYCHGFPGSRLEAAFADGVASSLGVRIIAIDRPGIGASDACPDRTILDWTDDVGDLAEHLRLDAFCVLGVSGGAPYALACAYRLAARIRSVAIVSGLGPPEWLSRTSPASTCGLGLRAIRLLPSMASVLAGALGFAARHASPLLLALLSARAPALDRRALGHAEFRSMLATSLREAFRNGSSGAATDLSVLARSWGFSLGGLRRPIQLWHGEQDRVVPATMGHCLQRARPDCRATYLEEHGHYSLVHDYVQQILSRLID
jgi:pimeloyl-ACP methyl ester carboxylesterase